MSKRLWSISLTGGQEPSSLSRAMILWVLRRSIASARTHKLLRRDTLLMTTRCSDLSISPKSARIRSWSLETTKLTQVLVFLVQVQVLQKMIPAKLTQFWESLFLTSINYKSWPKKVLLTFQKKSHQNPKKCPRRKLKWSKVMMFRKYFHQIRVQCFLSRFLLKIPKKRRKTSIVMERTILINWMPL